MTDLKNMPEEFWKKKLTPSQYRILRDKGTWPSFTGAFLKNKGKGMYKCAACGTDLFSSDTKYESGTGWPSFWDAVDSKNIDLAHDKSFGMDRIEVNCAKCGSHLGHLFNDGPKSLDGKKASGKRYCINSCALSFKSSS